MSVAMALTDYIPVALFIAGAILLQRVLYDELPKGAYALLAGGTIMVSTAGIFKATWKLLYALGVYDFERLTQSFFPMQSVGFMLAGIAAAAYAFGWRIDKNKVYEAAVPVFAGTMIFVALNVLGALGLCGGMAKASFDRKRKLAGWLFIIAFVGMLMMGYLSTKDFDKAIYNWIAQGVNTLAEGAFLAASVQYAKAKKEG